MSKTYVIMDAEISVKDKRIQDLGALKWNKEEFHGPSFGQFLGFISDCEFLCGHNIVQHDLQYVNIPNVYLKYSIIDTLYWSPLLFPKRPYHKLLKDDKLQSDQLNNPLNDCKKAEQLFFDEINEFANLPKNKQRIYFELLGSRIEFKGLFSYLDYHEGTSDLSALIKSEFYGLICNNAELAAMINRTPVELAYALALIGVNDDISITPPWILHKYPVVENIVKYLCNTPCENGCTFCNEKLNIHKNLKKFFGFDSFRLYDGEPLQEKSVQAAVEGKSLLSIFPTGGGKSLTFQLPAMMAGKQTHGLTVVISPLQSLMKDQVDNLTAAGYTDAIYLNGLLDAISRANAISRIRDGSAKILYISPEQLRSRTIHKILSSRYISRFVVDEAHCFSAWGQDFRVDYLYIGDFIRKLQAEKGPYAKTPVSCFTATAKPKVISDIVDYFKRKLDIDMELFASNASRKNLKYMVLFKETDEEKYASLRSLIATKNCPTIVYVSRTKNAEKLAEKLTHDGFPSKPYHGQMDVDEKTLNQEDFIANRIQVIVATSAFGMGIDKKDVKLVIHYDISNSLENYVQEAGRAGRDPTINAECYVLFNNADLDKHFLLLNQTKLSIAEIQQVWKAIKDLTKTHQYVHCSPLEIARQAGWENGIKDVETRVKTAITALENAGFIQRGDNTPHVFATSILAKNMTEASALIEQSKLYSEEQKLTSRRIISSLISSRSIAQAGNDDAESRVDYLADILGLEKEKVIESINIMKQQGLLADDADMSAFIKINEKENRSMTILKNHSKLERFLCSHFEDGYFKQSLKEVNDEALNSGLKSTDQMLRTIMYFLTIKNYIKKEEDKENNTFSILSLVPKKKYESMFEQRIKICVFVLTYLFEKSYEIKGEQEEKQIEFSVVGLCKEYNSQPSMDVDFKNATLSEVQEALLYLSKIGALKLEGGFLVTYNTLEIHRLVQNSARYKTDDYKLLNDFYKQKIQQIHIVGEYANLMVKDYSAALQFVNDYFQIDYDKFISKYFIGERKKEINRNITPELYNQLFNDLSDIQSEIINDDTSRYIVVAAGPGSGKTRVLVHKLAALLLMEDVKSEQLLMVTFSRAAATEFKRRLKQLIGKPANFVEIKTFHSYCFDLLGKIGNLESASNVVHDAAEMIMNGEVEQDKITKRVLVIDEAQDMDEDEFNLVRALIQQNEDMRIIAVGDDDQNIYEFRGSDSKYLQILVDEYGAKKYEMLDNYRSLDPIVSLSNWVSSKISSRLKNKPVVPVNNDQGLVVITNHSNDNMEEALVKELIATKKDKKVCVLTSTNEQALIVMNLLIKNNVPAKLIQSLDGFDLFSLVEIRYLFSIFEDHLTSPVISDDLWNKAKDALKIKYKDSSCLDNCINMMDIFSEANETKYKSDFESFIHESKYEDFYPNIAGQVHVSTIHKSKGQEFDKVYMLLNNYWLTDDSKRRCLYVGITRAKQELYIHCNNELFRNCLLPFITKVNDNNDYPDAEEITLQMTHRDVNLGFFRYKTNIVNHLRSGNSLNIVDDYLVSRNNDKEYKVAKFSKQFSEKFNDYLEKGYSPVSSTIRFIVMWNDEDNNREIPIVLADIQMKKLYKC